MRTLVVALSLAGSLVTASCNRSPDEVESLSPSALVVRTDFSNDMEWERLKEMVLTPIEPGYVANVRFIEVHNSAEKLATEIASNVSPPYQLSFIFVADRRTFDSHENTLLIASLSEGPRAEFRVLPSKVAEVEANLSVANVSFEEFAEAADENAVYRGL